MDNCIEATNKLLELIKVPYTRRKVREEILTHPDHPSILAISDTLKKYKVENLAIKCSFEELQQFPLPGIIQVYVAGHHLFYVIVSVSDERISCYDDKHKLNNFSKEDFQKMWTGVCLLVEKTENSGEEGYKKSKYKKYSLTFLTTITVLIFLLWGAGNILENWDSTSISLLYTLPYLFLKVFGLLAAGVLLSHEISGHNPLLRALCSGNKKSDCSQVLSSKYSNFFEFTSISSLVFSYFFATSTYLFFQGFSDTTLSVLFYGSILAAPAIFISAYYQFFVIKKWCRVCLLIQGILVLEVAIGNAGHFFGVVKFNSVLILLGLFILPILVWVELKPLLEKNREVILFKRQIRKIKNNPDVLQALTNKSRKIKTSTTGLGIKLHNESAKYHVLKICNPYCAPCAKAHPILEELVESGKINLQILFNFQSSSTNSDPGPIDHFLALDATGDKSVTRKALHKWYTSESKDYKTFAKQFPMNGQLSRQREKIEAMNKWCRAEKISHTPTIFIDGSELPKEYTIEDLKDVLI